MWQITDVIHCLLVTEWDVIALQERMSTTVTCFLLSWLDFLTENVQSHLLSTAHGDRLAVDVQYHSQTFSIHESF